MFSDLEAKMYQATQLIVENTDADDLDWRDEVICLLIDSLQLVSEELKDILQTVATPFDS